MNQVKSFKQFNEEIQLNNHINSFVDYACKELQIESKPTIHLVNDKKAALENTSFGSYSPSEHKIAINIAGRHTADILRTLAHELVHHRQNLDGLLHSQAGETGSSFENEANSLAGIMMRNYGKMNSKIYEDTEVL
jgi:hypothetical protein